jgi:hypothetical protein
MQEIWKRAERPRRNVLSMPSVFGAGVIAALAMLAITAALHLLNQPSDFSVAVGYLMLLSIVSLAVGAVQHYRRDRSRRIL